MMVIETSGPASCFRAATICDGFSEGDRSYTPACRSPERPACLTAIRKARGLLITPFSNSSWLMSASLVPFTTSTVMREPSEPTGSSARASGRYHCTKSRTTPCSIDPGCASTHANSRGEKASSPTKISTPRRAITAANHASRISGWKVRRRRIGPSRWSRSSRIRALRRSFLSQRGSGCRVMRSPAANAGGPRVQVFLQDEAGRCRVCSPDLRLGRRPSAASCSPASQLVSVSST